MTVRADYRVLNAAVADLPARVAASDEAAGLPAVLAHYPYAEDLNFFEYALCVSCIALRFGACARRSEMRELALRGLFLLGALLTGCGGDDGGSP